MPEAALAEMRPAMVPGACWRSCRARSTGWSWRSGSARRSRRTWAAARYCACGRATRSTVELSPYDETRGRIVGKR